MIKLKDDINAGVVKKQYILGRRNNSEEGVLLVRTSEDIREVENEFSIGDVVSRINEDERLDNITKMGAERGIAFVVDDTSESMHIVKVRPRYSWHGGNEPNALNRSDI